MAGVNVQVYIVGSPVTVKLESVPFGAVTSATVKPVTSSLNVNVIVVLILVALFVSLQTAVFVGVFLAILG